MIAKIAVSAAVFSIDKPYSYRIPPELTVFPGQRVMVPFGRGNRRTEGVVLSVEEGEENSLKLVERCLDPEPLLSPTMLRLAAFMCRRYFCTFYDAVRAILPAGLWFQSRDIYRCGALTEKQSAALENRLLGSGIVRFLQAAGGKAEYSALRKAFPPEEALREELRWLTRKGILKSDTEMLRRVGDKTEQIVTLTADPETARRYAEKKASSAPLQAEVLRLLTSVGSACAKEVMYFTGANPATLRRLETLGFLELTAREVLRRVEWKDIPPAEPLVLNEAQEQVFSGLSAQLTEAVKTPALLYGVTGSGKTSVYIRLISQVLEQDMGAILLVPEIALTPQLLRRMASHFGDRVAVLHSSLRAGERYDEWKRIRSGDARVVIGTRSAVFAPVQRLGLLILDEEQEHTYKSENTPAYHAREIALWRGLRENALVVFGSATPSVETMFRAQRGEYVLYTLRERYNGKALPPAELVDLRRELKNGNNTSISAALAEGLRQCVAEGRQAILFLNRRGNSRFQVCVDCGEVPQCPRCSVSLTYHSVNHRLMCHYCGHSQRATERCPRCGGHLKSVGAGTQRVQEELETLLPGTPILRMDADTITAANNHEELLRRFREEKIPVLLGTQMVAKGLDFPNVTLVGVLDADQSLYVENYRAGETTFSMVAQVVGRAGRGAVPGRALIQTMTPENELLLLAAEQDYDRFFAREIELRERRNFPPFADLTVIGFSGENPHQVEAGAQLFCAWLREGLSRPEYREDRPELLGPCPAPVMKINNVYRYKLTLCGKSTPELRKLLSELLRAFPKQKMMNKVFVSADMNPYE